MVVAGSTALTLPPFPRYSRLCSQHLLEGTAWTRPRGVGRARSRFLFSWCSAHCLFCLCPLSCRLCSEAIRWCRWEREQDCRA